MVGEAAPAGEPALMFLLLLAGTLVALGIGVMFGLLLTLLADARASLREAQEQLERLHQATEKLSRDLATLRTGPVGRIATNDNQGKRAAD